MHPTTALKRYNAAKLTTVEQKKSSSNIASSNSNSNSSSSGDVESMTQVDQNQTVVVPIVSPPLLLSTKRAKNPGKKIKVRRNFFLILY
jgi:hypothetical protein